MRNMFLKRLSFGSKVSKGAKIRNRYIQVPHLTQDTNGKVTNSQLATTNESQEASPPPPPSRRPQRTYKQTRTEAQQTQDRKNTKDPQKKYRFGRVSKIFYWRAQTSFTALTSPLTQMWIKTHRYLVGMKEP